jgi:hypothetical protein
MMGASSCDAKRVGMPGDGPIGRKPGMDRTVSNQGIEKMLVRGLWRGAHRNSVGLGKVIVDGFNGINLRGGFGHGMSSNGFHIPPTMAFRSSSAIGNEWDPVAMAPLGARRVDSAQLVFISASRNDGEQASDGLEV